MIIFSNCSEIIYKLKSFKENEETEKFITELMKKFDPDPEWGCDEFAFYDELDSDTLLVRGRDDSHEDDFVWMFKQAKKLGIKVIHVGDKEAIPLFSEGDNFYYKLGDKVHVANLSYSNIPKADKINQKLLKAWKRGKRGV